MFILTMIFAGFCFAILTFLKTKPKSDSLLVSVDAKNTKRIIVALGFLVLVLSFIRGYTYVQTTNSLELLKSFDGCRVAFIGEVVHGSIIEESKVVVVLETKKVTCNEEIFYGKVKLRVSLPHYLQSYTHGDILEISGMYRAPEPFASDSGRIFHYDMYLAKDRIVGNIGYPTVNFIESNSGLVQKIYIFKNYIVSSIQSLLTYPIDGLVIGMILGVDGALSENLETQYRRAGLIHIVVLSGFNVTIIAEAIRRLLPFGLRTNLICACVGIWLFAIMVGASATVVRATIMASIVLFVRATKEEYSVFHSLWIAAVIMALINPFILAYDPSFHLSFLATCGIVYLSPVIEKWFIIIPEYFELRFTICGTLATQIFVFPYLAYAMGEISIAAFFVNVLTVSFVPIIMAGGFLLFIVDVFIPIRIIILEWVLTLLVEYQLKIVELASSLSWATISLPPLTKSMLIAIYIVICAGTWFVCHRSKESDALSD